MTWAEFGTNIVNNPIAILATLLLVIVVVVGVKQGWFKFKGKGLQIGGDEEERKILRNQFDFCESFFDKFVFDPKLKQFDENKVKHIADKCQNIVERAILFNHISTDNSYIEPKAEMVYSAILKRSDSDFVRTLEFEAEVKKQITILFKRLYDLRVNK